MQTAASTLACKENIMASTTFSGPVTSTNGFVGALGNVTPAAVTATALTASGVVKLTALPTADPLVAGAIWSNSGVLTLSVTV
jgi:hypothetical protein